mgnify:FL=1
MTIINRTFTLSEEGKTKSNHGWSKVTIHALYPFISTIGRQHTPSFFWPIRNLFFPKGWFKEQSFKERLKALNWPSLPGRKQLVHRLACTATCDGDFEACLIWDDFLEEVDYGLYVEGETDA